MPAINQDAGGLRARYADLLSQVQVWDHKPTVAELTARCKDGALGLVAAAVLACFTSSVRAGGLRVV